MTGKRVRLCYVVSSEMTVAAFLKHHIVAATAAGYDVSVVANTRDHTFLTRLGLSVALYPIGIIRSIVPWRDALALLSLYRLFRKQGFDIVHSVSPKAGVLAMLSARMCGVPNRIHTFTGQVWVTRAGFERWLLRRADVMLARLTTRALVDSPSQRNFLIAQGVIRADKIELVGKGSICGVDSERFCPNTEARCAVRRKLGIPECALLLLYLGRFSREKGLLDLVKAFAILSREYEELHLLLVGPDEEDLGGKLAEICTGSKANFHLVGYTSQPELYMASADIFCLPSYREGFGTAIIEAAAVGIPSLASRIYGITDSVVDGKTGLLHTAGDVNDIVRMLKVLLLDTRKRLEMGVSARRRAVSEFSHLALSRELLLFYKKLVSI